MFNGGGFAYGDADSDGDVGITVRLSFEPFRRSGRINTGPVTHGYAKVSGEIENQNQKGSAVMSESDRLTTTVLVYRCAPRVIDTE